LGCLRHTRIGSLLFICAMVTVLGLRSVRASSASDPWTAEQVIEPAALVKALKQPENKPLVLQVGFGSLYDQARIPGAEYCGPASKAEGIAKLKACLRGVAKTTDIVFYCGCCPWRDCPNISPALKAVRQMGFTKVRVLYIPHNFGQDWVQHGYPVIQNR
jgi:thiosulfate/3-mercaptopyruvate sulfurtransferase